MHTNIRIVLVEPSHPGNIGGAARAMKTMGLDELVVVNPRRFPPTTPGGIGGRRVLWMSWIMPALSLRWMQP